MTKSVWSNWLTHDPWWPMAAVTYLASRSINSSFDIPSGSNRGIAATQVLKRSIFGFLSPLECENRVNTVKGYEKLFENWSTMWTKTRTHTFWITPGVFSMLSLNDYAVYSLAGSKSTYEDLNVRQRYISEEKNADVNSILPHGLSFTWVLRGLVPVGCF